MNQLDQMKDTIERIETRLGMGSANVSGNGSVALDRSSPADQVLLQQQGQQKFIGNLLWDAFNLITFGAFERKPTSKKPPPEDAQKKQEEEKKKQQQA